MIRSRRIQLVAAVAGTAFLVAAVAAAVVSHPSREAAAVAMPLPIPSGADPLAQDIARQQATLRAGPDDAAAWAALGLDYVQQAKITVEPEYYPKATGALARSLALDPTDNIAGMAGEAALQAAEHHFAAARDWATRGLAADPYSSTLYGALDDADTQLGLYPQAFAAAQRMNDLYPGVPAATRAEYVYELQGDTAAARRAMQTALADATSPADKGFAWYYLGELAFTSGDPRTAFADSETGLRADPTSSALLEGKARAEAALGRTAAAVADYATVVAAVPQPQYVVEAGDLLASLDRTAAAQQDYQLFDTENMLFTANGVALDTDPTLFYADHGQPARALAYGVAGIKVRPFLEMDDAYAWALHANGRNAEALTWEHRALRLGTRNALFVFHLGMIERSLGQVSAGRADLRRALAINPYFSPYDEPILRAALAAPAPGR